MMSEDMHPPVTPAKKCAEQPAHDRNDDRAENCAPEPRNFETRNNLTHELQHQRVDDQNEDSERDKNQRKTEQQQNRTNKGIDNAKQKRCAQETPQAAAVIDAHDRRGDEYRECRHNPTENKMPHAQSLLDNGPVAKSG